MILFMELIWLSVFEDKGFNLNFYLSLAIISFFIANLAYSLLILASFFTY